MSLSSYIADFQTLAQQGVSYIQPSVLITLGAFAVIELVMLGLQGLSGKSVTIDFYVWGFKYCIFLYIANNWNTLTKDVYDFALGIAAKSTGSSGGEAIFKDPSKVYNFFADSILEPFRQILFEKSLWKSIFSASTSIIASLIGFAVIGVLCIVFFFIEFEIAKTIVSFYLVCLFSYVMFPFYFNKHTKHLATNVFISIFKRAFDVGINIFGLTILWKIIEANYSMSNVGEGNPFSLITYAFALTVLVAVYKWATKQALNSVFPGA